MILAHRQQFGAIAFVNSDAAADFLRVKIAELKAESSGLSPFDPGRVRILVVEDETPPAGVPSIDLITQIPDFAAAIDAVRAALSAKGVSRARLDELNAFPDPRLVDTIGELIPRLENLVRIYDTAVRGILPSSGPSAIPLVGGIFIGFLVIGSVLYYVLTRRG